MTVTIIRQLLTALFFLFLFAASVSAQDVADSGLVRIRVDQDGVLITLDGVLWDTDTDGNVPTKQSWFVIPVIRGEHTLILTKAGYQSIERSVIVESNEVLAVEVSFQSEVVIDSTSTTPLPADPTQPAKLQISADPSDAVLRVDEAEQTTNLPVRLELAGGDHTLVVASDGYEELSHQLTLPPGEIISLNFLLRENQPFPISAEELELEYQAEIPLMDEKMADRLRQRYYGLAETFAIIPLAQGIIARLIVGDDGKNEANALVIVGVGLTGGSYLLGRILSSRKRSQILAHNERATLENGEAKANNKDIDRLIREKNAEALSEWESINQRRGRVEIRDE